VCVAAAASSADDARLRAAHSDPHTWLSHGRTYDEQRFSPLAAIDRRNVAQLGLAWSYETRTKRGLEATPLVVDGVLYATASWSVVFALDAASGRELWRFDPQVPRWRSRYACCDVVNRGVAFWKGRVYVGTIDGRLIALDAATGTPAWDVLTVDPDRAYTITGAPRVVKGKVIIGNGGADLGVRGHFSAYDAETGERVWRFYTVPASRNGPHEHPELEAAAATWSADSLWESGLGGTVWDAFAYDPELDLLYAGVGNSSVYAREQRSPGGGDNLYLTSILALRPDTGRLVWHYQTVPGERWDYTATQPMILADLAIGGRTRQVLMQAPKNGFFYVLDRASGELLAADPFVPVSWASHVDLATGRPVERPEADWSKGPAFVTPAPPGAHNWHPMAWSPQTRLVYIPVSRATYRFHPDPAYRFMPRTWNTAEDWNALSLEMEEISDAVRFCAASGIVAWDPETRSERWRVDHDHALPAGLLTTGGGLVFGGDADALVAYDARSGRELWRGRTGAAVMAPPVTYTANGVQHVVVLAGAGGSHGGHMQKLQNMNEGRVLAFALGGEAALPPVTPRPEPRVSMPETGASPQVIANGRSVYARHCARCHGIGANSSGLRPDLRYASAGIYARWNEVVLGGILKTNGMPPFDDLIDADDALAVRAYVSMRAHHEPGYLERALRWAGTQGLCVPHDWMAD
jgi:quinohemoprotein ethanol dehydrogenase